MPSLEPSGARPAVLSRDTDRSAELLQVRLWRRMPAGAKLRSAAAVSTASVTLTLTGIRRRDPLADETTRFLRLARIRLGDIANRLYDAPWAAAGQRTTMDILDVALSVAAALERCGHRYVVGGSLASSISGEPRSTLDVDFMVEITEQDVPGIIAGLGADFHAEPESFARAIRHRSSVNVIHLPTATKVDLFVMGATPIEPEQMDRRISVELPERAGAQLFVYTPEDILLQKLRWYRLGRETSDRQWRDILGIIAVQAGALDLTYLRRGATQIGAADLLERAMSEAPQ